MEGNLTPEVAYQLMQAIYATTLDGGNWWQLCFDESNTGRRVGYTVPSHLEILRTAKPSVFELFDKSIDISVQDIHAFIDFCDERYQLR